MLKKLSLVILAGVFAVSVAGCGGSSDSKAKPKTPSQEMIVLSSTVMSAAQIAMLTAISQVKGKAVETVSGDGWSAEIDYTDNGTSVSYDITFTWDGFVSQGVTFSSGTTEIVGSASETETSYDYTGDFVVIYQDTTYDFGWDISVSMNMQTYAYTYEGTFSVDGVLYSWGSSGK